MNGSTGGLWRAAHDLSVLAPDGEQMAQAYDEQTALLIANAVNAYRAAPAVLATPDVVAELRRMADSFESIAKVSHGWVIRADAASLRARVTELEATGDRVADQFEKTLSVHDYDEEALIAEWRAVADAPTGSEAPPAMGSMPAPTFEGPVSWR